jgi:uncharacterized protein (DUF2062 family)
MPKHLIKRYIPSSESVRNNRLVALFGSLLHDANLWHLNRRSVSGAFAIGLFWAMIPVPLQMLAAASCAIIWRVNLTISVALVWVTNPLTMPPVFYVGYLVGTWILGEPAMSGKIEWSLTWMTSSLANIWLPLFLGTVVLGALTALLGFFGIRIFWRWHIIHKYRKRRHGVKGVSLPSRS